MLLDMCALLWLVNAGDQLTQAILERIDVAPAVFISAISGFEIGLKYRKGKLEMPLPPEEWLKIAVNHHQLSVIALDLETCVHAAGLPPIHNDPCDRFIIATAKLHHLPVVTADSRFREYGVQVIF